MLDISKLPSLFNIFSSIFVWNVPRVLQIGLVPAEDGADVGPTDPKNFLRLLSNLFESINYALFLFTELSFYLKEFCFNKSVFKFKLFLKLLSFITIVTLFV